MWELSYQISSPLTAELLTGVTGPHKFINLEQAPKLRVILAADDAPLNAIINPMMISC